MIYTIEKRTGREYGGLVSWYEIRRYTGASKIGYLVNGETIKQFKALKEAKTYCKENQIEYERS